jgi:hypothetical protein
MTIDGDKLKEDLKEELGAAWQAFPFAVGGLGQLENATGQQLVEMANMLGKDLSDYEIKDDGMSLDLNPKNRF